MKTLIIAEKPSVATDLARVLASKLGKFEKVGKSRDAQYFESENALISSAVGHLVELKMPTAANGKNLPWKFDVLPAIPKVFELQPIEDTAGRLRHLLSLAKRKDVTLIVNACDAGREGELIFQYIMDIGEIKKPVKRLWMQSMTDGAIKEAWGKLREGSEMKPLADAARCRSESDWLVGLNSTRALTCFRSRHGGFNITAAGRVQTPTLAILAKRELEIKSFISKGYSEIVADFAVRAGQYPGTWVDLDWKKNAEDPHSKPERIWTRERAEVIRNRCEGKTGTVTEEKKPQKQIAPQLYDLTTLQREAPFTASQTLQIVQGLYERHKMVTYPRTDSRYLPEDYMTKVIETTRELADSSHPIATWAADSIKNKRIVFDKRVFNNAKVSDHFAIIPTGRIVKLKDAEEKLFDMIVKRFVAVFFPSAEFELTNRLTIINHTKEKDAFRTNGKTLVFPGWLAVYGRVAGVAASKDELVPVTSGEKATVEAINIETKETKPPARYTEATLLSAMEGAGKLLDDEELREAMAERGLGTPATRAATIEGLLAQKYIAREGKDLNVTGKGLRLIELLEEMKIEPLTSPTMTGDWEYKLRQMEHGKLDRSVFMEEIANFTCEVVDKARNHLTVASNKDFPDVPVICPSCSASNLKQTDATYECRVSGCDFKVSKHIAGRMINEEEAVELFTNKLLSTRSGFLSRFNKPFEAGLELTQTSAKGGGIKWKVGFVFEGSESMNTDELTDEQCVKTLTLPNGVAVKLYETEKAFLIPELKTKESPEGFRIGKTILQKTLTLKEVEPLLVQGKTGVIDGFISNKTKRPFKAYLTLDLNTGKVGFEFPPREAKKTASKGKAKVKEEGGETEG